MRDCVHHWLADVDDEFPAVEPRTRRELAEHYQHKVQAHIRDANAGEGYAILRAYVAVLRITTIARQAAADRDPAGDHIPGIALIARTAAGTAQTASQSNQRESNLSPRASNTRILAPSYGNCRHRKPVVRSMPHGLLVSGL